MADNAVRDLYDSQTEEVIRNRMLENVDESLDKREGSIVFDMLSPSALESAFLYGALATAFELGFADTSYGEYIDRRCAEVGMTRKPATKAVGKVVFTGTTGSYIPAGTQVTTNGVEPILFETDSEYAIGPDGTAIADVTAVEAGVKGNVSIGKVTVLTQYLSGISSVTNAINFDGGSDIETDTDLLARYFIRMQTPATSGNIYEYQQWALSVPGIGAAKVFPLWDGNGTVKVTLLDTEKTPPDETIIDDVRTYIESVRPIGATVTVQGATAVPIDITASLVLEPNVTIEDTQEDILLALKEYLAELAYNDPICRISQIANHILDSSYVLDYMDLTINDQTGNLVIADGEVAVLGTVNFVVGV